MTPATSQPAVCIPRFAGKQLRKNCVYVGRRGLRGGGMMSGYRILLQPQAEEEGMMNKKKSLVVATT